MPEETFRDWWEKRESSKKPEVKPWLVDIGAVDPQEKSLEPHLKKASGPGRGRAGRMDGSSPGLPAKRALLAAEIIELLTDRRYDHDAQVMEVPRGKPGRQER